MRWIPGAAAAALLTSCITIQMPPAAPPPPPPSAGSTPPSSGQPAPPPAAVSPASAPAGGDRRLIEQMTGIVNDHRRAAGCPALVWMQTVANAAQGHSDDMARRDYFNHESPEGLGPAERLRAHGVGFRAMGENIALHPGGPREVLAQWVGSPGHRRNLDQCAYTHHGIGLRNGLWTHLFITPLPPARPAGT
jgi:uncharacterized protein YkwD